MTVGVWAATTVLRVSELHWLLLTTGVSVDVAGLVRAALAVDGNLDRKYVQVEVKIVLMVDDQDPFW